MNLAIIPARGGSKGVPNKNLQKINGKSLIAIAVEKLCSLPFLDGVYVSTDSDEIALEAFKHGAKIHRRPDSISGDSSTSEEAIMDLLMNLELESGCQLLFHQCTSPLLSEESLLGLWETFKRTNADCVFTVSEECNPIWIADNMGFVKALFEEKGQRKPRQERGSMYVESGGAYAFSADRFFRDKNRFGVENRMFIVSRIEAIDVDTKDDLLLVSKLIDVK